MIILSGIRSDKSILQNFNTYVLVSFEGSLLIDSLSSCCKTPAGGFAKDSEDTEHCCLMSRCSCVCLV